MVRENCELLLKDCPSAPSAFTLFESDCEGIRWQRLSQRRRVSPLPILSKNHALHCPGQSSGRQVLCERAVVQRRRGEGLRRYRAAEECLSGRLKSPA